MKNLLEDLMRISLRIFRDLKKEVKGRGSFSYLVAITKALGSLINDCRRVHDKD